MEAIRKTIVDVDLTKKLHRVFSGVLLAESDKLANRMGANVFQDGKAVSLSGYTVKGYFIRNGTDTIVVNGAVSGNTAYVELPSNCYFHDGSYTLAVKLCQGGKEMTLVIFDGQIGNTITDTIVENENTLSLADLVQQEWVESVLDAADAALVQANKAAESAAQAQAIKDSIPPDYTEAVKQIDQKAPAIFADASGDMVRITDGAAMPVQSLVTHIEPVQSGTGDPSPNNVRPISGWDKVTAHRTGKNWFSGAEEITFVWRSAYIKLDCPLAPGTYTISALVTSTDTDATVCWAGFVGGDNDGTMIYAAVDRNTRSASTITLSRPVSEVFLNAATSYAASEGDTATWKQVQIELGTTATEYEPYQGGQSISAALPETVYGGDKNWTSGEQKSTKYMYQFTGDEVFTKSSTRALYSMSHNDNPTNWWIAETVFDQTSKNIVCSHFKGEAYASLVNDCVATYLGTQGKGVCFFAPSFTDVAAFTTFLKEQYNAGTPVTVVCDLEPLYWKNLTPGTPQQLSTLKGVNNIWSDAGETEVTYAADTKMYIDQKIAAIVNN